MLFFSYLLSTILFGYDRFWIHTKETIYNSDTSKKYVETRKIIQEVMKDYYLRGINVQYHNSRRTTASPEDATKQDILYTVCSGYTYNVYNEALGMSDLPLTSDLLIREARDYYNNNKNDSNKMNGKFLLYYENTTDKKEIQYAYNNKTKFSDFVELVQPGDLFVFSGHAMMAYDVVDRVLSDGTIKKDVLLLNSNAKDEIKSRITYGTRMLSFSYRPVATKNNVVDVDIEGGVQYKWLSDFSSRFVASILYDKNEDVSLHDYTLFNCGKKRIGYWNKDNKYCAAVCEEGRSYVGSKAVGNYWVDCSNLTLYNVKSKNNNVEIGSCSNYSDNVYDSELMCQMDECVVIRPYYEGTNGETVFNYSIKETNYNTSKLRLEYPGLIIEKTVNKGDNNSVYPNDELEYTIKITNKSSAVKNSQKKYGKFSIDETIDSNTEFISATNNGKLSNNKIKWTVNSLNIDSSIELKYVVRVKAEVSQTIEAKGVFYNPSNGSTNEISTGLVSNKIVHRAVKVNTDYKSCFNKYKSSKKGLALLDEIYKCARGVNFSFTDFQFEKMFSIHARESNQIIFDIKNGDNKSNLFKQMVLNNYWGGIAVLENDDYDIIPLKYGDGNRKKTFNDSDFQNGDILIYSIDYDKGVYNPFNPKTRVSIPTANRHTKEKGIYAYIYLDGKFVGVNGSGETARNEFTYHYYSDTDIPIHLYSNVANLGKNKDFYLTMINYNTLLDKDFYIILRPELVINDTEFKIKNTNKVETKNDMFICKIDYKEQMLYSTLLNNIDFNIDIFKIKNGNGNYVNNNNEILGTGSKIIINKEYPIVIKGDINGDGKISSLDYITIKNHSLNIQKISDVSKTEAADVNNDNKISALDYVKIRNMIIGSK